MRKWVGAKAVRKWVLKLYAGRWVPRLCAGRPPKPGAGGWVPSLMPSPILSPVPGIL